MIVSVQWCNDTNSFNYGYTFWHNRKKVAQCDELDYHETVTELILQGYIIRQCYHTLLNGKTQAYFVHKVGLF